MNRQFYWQNSQWQNKSGLVILEGAILSAITLSLFLTVLGFTEHLNLLNLSNQVLNQELNHNTFSNTALEQNKITTFEQENFLNDFAAKIKQELQAKKITPNNFFLESALSAMNNNETVILKKYFLGNQTLSKSLLGTTEEILLAYSKNSLALYSSDYKTKFINNKEQKPATTFFISGRLVIRPESGILKILEKLGKDLNIKTEVILPFKLNYSL